MRIVSNIGAHRAMRVWRVALALALALGFVPASALAEGAETAASIDVSESLEQSNCVIARPDDMSKLEDEPIVAMMGDACLMSYESEKEAEEAAKRLSEFCDFAEVDSSVYAAETGEDSFGGVEDKPSELSERGSEADVAREPHPEGSGEAKNANEALDGEQDDKPSSVGVVQDAVTDAIEGVEENKNSPEELEEASSAGEAPPSGLVKPSEKRENAANSDDVYEGLEDDGKGGTDDTTKTLVALVDSGAPQGVDLAGSVSVLGDNPEDENGHATRMYNAIRSQAPDADIVSIRALDASGRGTVAATYAGIEEAIELGADIVNLSLYAPLDTESTAINAAVQDAREAGIVVVAAAGNDGVDAAGYVPANAEGAVTAGSCDEQGARLPESNYGNDVDVFVASDATSIAAARVTGWFASHRDSNGGFPSISEAFDGEMFFPNEGGDGSPERTEREEVEDSGLVKGAMAIQAPIAEELRPSASRVGSSLPRSTIYIDDGGKLPMRDAQLSGDSKFALGTYTVGLATNLTASYYGVYVANPAKGVSGTYSGTLGGSFTLKWNDIAEDEEGNRLDLALTFSNIVMRTAQETAKKSERVLLVWNNSAGKLMMSSRMQAVAGINNQPRMGVKTDVKATFTKAGTQQVSDGSYLFCVTDLDQPDSSIASVSALDYNGAYAEAVQLLTGFETATYKQKTIAQGDGPDPGPWLLRCDAANGKFTATQSNSYDSQMRAGFVALSSAAEFSFRWWGSYCDTPIFSDYEGIVIRDKNDPAQAGITDQGIVTKNVNAKGLKTLPGGVSAVDESSAFDADTNHGGRRTNTEWRSTNMRWLGSSTYRVSAQKGFRVTNVKVVDELGATNDLGVIRELGFASAAESDTRTYRSDRDYDIVVTTARVPDAAATIHATKELVGRDLEEGEFTFELYEGERKIGEARNAATGNITFLPIEYTYSDQQKYPVMHEYLIKEVAGDNELVKYDDAEYAVSVIEEYDEKAGVLSARVNYEDEPAFVNEFEKRGGVRVKKIDEDDGRALAGAEFTVEAEAGSARYTMTSRDDGIAELDATTLPTGAYRVHETRAPEGYELNESWSVSFAIEEAGQIVDLTSAPCADIPDVEVSLPRTGAAGASGMLAAAFIAVITGLILRKRIAAV